MIRYADAINVLGGEDGRGDYRGYKPLQPKALARASPDLLIVTSEGLGAIGGVTKLLETTGLALTTAAINHRVVSNMDSLLLPGFGPRLPEALIKLSAQLV